MPAQGRRDEASEDRQRQLHCRLAASDGCQRSGAAGGGLIHRPRLGAAMTREPTPRDVLIDLFGGADFDHEILNPAAAAELIIERLRDAGFEIVPADRGSTTGAAAPDEIHPCRLTQLLRL